MTGWRDVTLGDVITLQRGFDLTKSTTTPGPYPVISSGGRSYTTDVRKVEGPGVITGRKGVLGKVHFSSGPYWPHDTTLWVKDFKGAEPRYIYYLLQVLPLASLDAGASNPTLNRNHAHLLPVRVPSVEIQRTISHTLGSIDDLIDNNRRRIELMERILQAIYREWFIYFRYPGHETATYVDSLLGPVPEGWQVTTCGDALTVMGGGTPSKKEPAYWEGGTIPWFTPSDLTRSRTRFAAEPALKITQTGLRNSSAKLFPSGSVLMTSRATLGVLAVANADATCNQGFIVIPPDPRWPPTFILEWLRASADELEALGTGATFKEITKGSFKRSPFLLPAEELLGRFRDTTTPIESKVRTLEESVRQLEALRDLLLSKLVTGQIDVSRLHLDGVVESVA